MNILMLQKGKLQNMKEVMSSLRELEEENITHHQLIEEIRAKLRM